MADAVTPFNIPELNEGVQRGIEFVGGFYGGPYKYVYAIVILVGFFLIAKDHLQGGALLRELGKYLLSCLLIILLFAVPEGAGKPPVGFSGALTVVNTVMGGLNKEAAKIPKLMMPGTNIDLANMPNAAFEKYHLKVVRAREAFAVEHAKLAPGISEYVADCQDSRKMRAAPPAYNYQEYTAGFRRDNAPPKCSQLGSELYNAVMEANNKTAKAENLQAGDVAVFAGGTDPRGRVLSEAEAAEVGERKTLNAVQKGMLAILLKVLGLASVIACLIYANVLPYFLGIVAQLLMLVYPLIVAMALMPGQGFAKIINYIEGYLWLSAMGLCISAVDGATFSRLAKADLFDLDATLLVLAKTAIVMTVPALASFLLFGTRGGFAGMSGVSGIIGGAAAAAVMTVTRAAVAKASGGASAAAGAAAGAGKSAAAGGGGGPKTTPPPPDGGPGGGPSMGGLGLEMQAGGPPVVRIASRNIDERGGGDGYTQHGAASLYAASAQQTSVRGEQSAERGDHAASGAHTATETRSTSSAQSSGSHAASSPGVGAGAAGITAGGGTTTATAAATITAAPAAQTASLMRSGGDDPRAKRGSATTQATAEDAAQHKPQSFAPRTAAQTTNERRA